MFYNLRLVQLLTVYFYLDAAFGIFPQPRLRFKECTEAGLMCASCNTIRNCILNEDGSFSDIPAGDCSLTTTCKNGQCVSDNPQCTSVTEIEFLCAHQGIFPNPGDCKRFVICFPDDEAIIGFSGHSYDCPPGFGYHSKTQLCNKVLVNNECPVSPILPYRPGDILRYYRSDENPKLMWQYIYHPFNILLKYPIQYSVDYLQSE